MVSKLLDEFSIEDGVLVDIYLDFDFLQDVTTDPEQS